MGYLLVFSYLTLGRVEKLTLMLLFLQLYRSSVELSLSRVRLS